MNLCNNAAIILPHLAYSPKVLCDTPAPELSLDQRVTSIIIDIRIQMAWSIHAVRVEARDACE